MTTKLQTECRHATIGFQSGDYYVFCRDCPAKWAAIDGLAGSDKPSPESSNKGVGSGLSGEDRHAITWDETCHESKVGDLAGTIIIGVQFMIQVEDHPCVKAGNYKNGAYMISIWSEDDGTWFKKSSFASYWLPDLISVLSQIPKEVK